MAVILAPAVNNKCESFTHNLLTWDKEKPAFLSLMEIHKECIANVSEFKSDFGVRQNVCSCVTMGNHKYLLH